MQDYDDVAFHEGNVPAEQQAALRRELPNLRLVSAASFGGFQSHISLPDSLASGANDGYSIRYRHMCQFMAMLWYDALREYKFAMRIDEDVCVTRLPHAELQAALAADYAYGIETWESHAETLNTFNPWLTAFISDARLQPAIPPLPTNRIFFTNLFVTRVAWWRSAPVRQLMSAINATGGIYLHRWGVPRTCAPRSLIPCTRTPYY